MINILDIKSVIETSMLSIYFQSDKEEFTTGGKKKKDNKLFAQHFG